MVVVVSASYRSGNYEGQEIALLDNYNPSGISASTWVVNVAIITTSSVHDARHHDFSTITTILPTTDVLQIAEQLSQKIFAASVFGTFAELLRGFCLAFAGLVRQLI